MTYESEFRRLSAEVTRLGDAQQEAADERARVVLAMRETMTQQAVADALGLTRGRVSQLEAQARKA